jgi:hypothetical protein
MNKNKLTQRSSTGIHCLQSMNWYYFYMYSNKRMNQVAGFFHLKRLQLLINDCSEILRCMNYRLLWRILCGRKWRHTTGFGLDTVTFKFRILPFVLTIRILVVLLKLLRDESVQYRG